MLRGQRGNGRKEPGGYRTSSQCHGSWDQRGMSRGGEKTWVVDSLKVKSTGFAVRRRDTKDNSI